MRPVAVEEQVTSESRPKRRRWRRLVGRALLGIVALYALATALAFAFPSERGRLPDLSKVPATSRFDPELSLAAQRLSGNAALVHCSSHADWRRQTAEWERRWPNGPELGPWAAYTSYVPFVQVNLSPEVCLELNRLRRLVVRAWDDAEADALAWSIGALAHEAIHASGNRVEVEATCFGMQSIAEAAAALGRTAAEARYLAEQYWRLWYERLKPSYRSPDCRDGGRLDIHPRSDVWP